MTRRPMGLSMRRRTPRPALGFTLVELLIAMALTLLLVYAVAKFYSYIGETVRDGRAQIEMGGNLRQAANRLEQDFAELTVRIGGRIDAGQGQGCFEIVEGVATDIDPNGDQVVDPNTGISPDVNLDPNSDGKPDGQMLGDMDDILVMTIRSQGQPFVGRRFTGLDANGNPMYAIIQSNLAEVIWFTTFKDQNGDGVWQMIEPRYLVRRQLLIVPPGTPISWPQAPNNLPAGQSIYHHNDISCHVTIDSMGNPVWIANSLSDLSQRENRCIHQNLSNLPGNGLMAGQGYMPNVVQLNVGLTNVPAIPLYQPGACSYYCLDGIPQFAGEDKILSNLMAFDVRVYDPYAPLWPDNVDLNGSTASPDDDAHGVVSPGDPGYAIALTRAVQNNIGNLGMGAYVDLWYTRAFANLPAAMRPNVLRYSNSAYAWAPQAKSYSGNFGVWDTWTTAYEKDGLDQFGDSNTDTMVDGLDNNNSAGVDDPGESETSPPYPVYIGTNGRDDDGQNGVDDAGEGMPTYFMPIASMLRGVEVRIRIYEPGTRQTRQVSVVTDFIPE